MQLMGLHCLHFHKMQKWTFQYVANHHILEVKTLSWQSVHKGTYTCWKELLTSEYLTFLRVFSDSDGLHTADHQQSYLPKLVNYRSLATYLGLLCWERSQSVYFK